MWPWVWERVEVERCFHLLAGEEEPWRLQDGLYVTDVVGAVSEFDDCGESDDRGDVCRSVVDRRRTLLGRQDGMR